MTPNTLRAGVKGWEWQLREDRVANTCMAPDGYKNSGVDCQCTCVVVVSHQEVVRNPEKLSWFPRSKANAIHRHSALIFPWTLGPEVEILKL